LLINVTPTYLKISHLTFKSIFNAAREKLKKLKDTITTRVR